MPESVSRAIMDFFGEVCRTFGFIGRPRRRADIREDLRLLGELDASPQLTQEAKEATKFWLNNQIILQVAAYADVDLRTVRRKVQWGAVFFSTCFWAPLGWLTYHLVSIGDGWWATFPAVPGGGFRDVHRSLTRRERNGRSERRG